MGVIQPDISFHSAELAEIISAAKTDTDKGLTDAEVQERLAAYGKNTITAQRYNTIWTILINQFKSPIVLMLLAAAGFSVWLDEWIDALAILVVVGINALVGFYMEFQANRSMDALRKMSAVPAKVLRNGKLSEINAEEIVPGDLVFAEAGDLVPADGRIVRLSQLMADESPLTGESIPVEKENVSLPSETPLAERLNMLYKGTFISKGNVYALVTSTGMDTELGKVASLVQSAKQSATPLEKKLEQFSKKLIVITVVLVGLVFTAGLLNGQLFIEMVGTAIALAVAAIPEGLPVVATLALARGVLRMSRHRVIVKQLSAVETLGGTTIICTDKTGTLTKNEIEVCEIKAASEKARELVLMACALCNTAEVGQAQGEEKEMGDPLEIGLLKYVAGQGMAVDELKKRFPKIKEEPFTSETKLMATLHRSEEQYMIFCKGAVEEILKKCDRTAASSGEKTMGDEEKKQWLQEAETLAASGLKVIATACREAQKEEKELSASLVFSGLIGLMDPPRKEVQASVKECREAGIHIVMITGDHPSTAKNIAQRLGIATDQNEEVVLGKNMTDYESLDQKEKELWIRTHVFARVNPKQKLDIVNALQEKGNIVAMTGDGINDAPALKKSDIGIAMGLRGTQAAQEVADMVLKDDSFSSIAVAIREGRIIFENIRRFVIFLLSCNLSELLVIATAAVLHLPFQLLPLQILFINLITDVLPALALGMTRGSSAIMQQPPHDITEPIIDRQRWVAIFVYSAVIALVSTGAVFAGRYFSTQWHPGTGNNILFFTLIFSQLLHVFNMGSNGTGFFRSEVVRNAYVWIALAVCTAIILALYFITPFREVLSVQKLQVHHWLICLSAALVSMVLIGLAKKFNLVRQ